MTREGYAAGTSFENGYPAEADILEYFSDRGLEIITENNPNFIVEFMQSLWGVLNTFDWAGALGVYCPSTTTFNVRGGKYLFAGEVKTYTPGTAVNPTDNDTTYIWMNYNNTIGSGIDGSGWPSTEHIKLAEIDVDADGVITNVRDLRGQTFLRDEKGIIMLASVASVNLNSVATTNLYVCLAGFKWIPDHVKLRNLSANATSAQASFGKSTAKTDFVAARTLSNLSAAGKACKIEPVPATTVAAIVEYVAGDIFVIDVTVAAGIACTATVEVFGKLATA